jgi:hypothetical protein
MTDEEVNLTPASASVVAGATQQFAASVTGTSNTAVSWAGCSGAACGTISSGGLYNAPAAVPSNATVIVTVTSAADSTKSASADLTITPAPVGALLTILRRRPTEAAILIAGPVPANRGLRRIMRSIAVKIVPTAPFDPAFFGGRPPAGEVYRPLLETMPHAAPEQPAPLRVQSTAVFELPLTLAVSG